jgi:hypothetical protein
MVPVVVGVVVILLTTLCFLYLCKRAADDGTLSDRGTTRRSMARNRGTMVEIGKAREAECAVCGAWPSALRPAMRNAIHTLPVKKPTCKACVVAWARNALGLRIEPEPKG